MNLECRSQTQDRHFFCYIPKLELVYIPVHLIEIFQTFFFITFFLPLQKALLSWDRLLAENVLGDCERARQEPSAAAQTSWDRHTEIERLRRF